MLVSKRHMLVPDQTLPRCTKMRKLTHTHTHPQQLIRDCWTLDPAPYNPNSTICSKKSQTPLNPEA